MRVLITGASGFLGSHLAEVFVAAGHTVRAFVRRTSKVPFLERLGVEVVRGDLKDKESLRYAVGGMEVVANAASTTSGIPLEYEEATVKGTAALLEAAQEAGVRRFIHISSIGVHKLRALPGNPAIAEETPYEDQAVLLTTYTRSKIQSERAALEAARRGQMKVLVLRPGVLYGPRGKWSLPRIGYPLGMYWYLVVGSGSNLLPVCYVRNCARAALMAAENDAIHSGAFNIVDDDRFTQIEYLRRLKADVRPALKILRCPYFLARGLGALVGIGMRAVGRPNPVGPAHLIMCRNRATYSNEKAKQVLDWRPEIGKEEALAETMRYHAACERVSRRANLQVLGKPAEGRPPLTACLVGCGTIAQEHLKILSRMKNARVLALCDLDEGRARQLAQRFKVLRTYGALAEMLEAERPAALHILTPPQSHALCARLAGDHGAHILVEKPMAVDAAAAQVMANSAAERGVRICVDHNKLYDPVVVRARRLIESGALGDVLWVESYYGFSLADNPQSVYMAPGGEKHWTFQLPGGLYQNLVPHPLCLALEFLGQPTKIHAYARYGRVLPYAPTDELRIILETPNACGLVTVSLAASPRMEYLNVHGTKMVLSVDLLNQWLITDRAMRGIPKPISRAFMNLRHGATVLRGTISGTAKVLGKRWTPYEGMNLLIREFYSSIQEGRDPPVRPDEAIHVMEIMDEVWHQIGPEGLSWLAVRTR